MFKSWTKLPRELVDAARRALYAGDGKLALRILAAIIMLDDMQRDQHTTTRDNARDELGLSARAWTTARRMASGAFARLEDERRNRSTRRTATAQRSALRARQEAGERQQASAAAVASGAFDYPPHHASGSHSSDEGDPLAWCAAYSQEPEATAPALGSPDSAPDVNRSESAPAIVPAFVSPDTANFEALRPLSPPPRFFLGPIRSQNAASHLIRLVIHSELQTPKAPEGPGDGPRRIGPAGALLAPPFPPCGGGAALPSAPTMVRCGGLASAGTDGEGAGIATPLARSIPIQDRNPAETRPRTPATVARRTERTSRGETVGLRAIRAWEAEIASCLGWPSDRPPPGVPGTEGPPEHRAVWAARARVRATFNPSIIKEIACGETQLRNPRAALGVWIRTYREQWLQDGAE